MVCPIDTTNPNAYRKDGYELAREIGIVWLQDVTRFPYLREGVVDAVHGRGPVGEQYLEEGGLIMGYAEVRGPYAIGGYRRYLRRIWWLKDHDCYGPEGPMEAVGIDSIRAGRPSCRWPGDCRVPVVAGAPARYP